MVFTVLYTIVILPVPGLYTNIFFQITLFAKVRNIKVLVNSKHGARIIKHVQAQIMMLKYIHAVQRVIKEYAQKHPHGAAVHAN